MKHLTQLKMAFAALALGALMSCEQNSATEKEAKTPPNILWIMAEDIGTDLEIYGMPAVKTPNLNKLAETGSMFTNAYGTNSICSPSRSNMITGVHQNVANTQHHRSNREIILRDSIKPITALLKEAGYTTILGSPIVRGKGRKIDVNFKHEAIGSWNGSTEFGLFDKYDSILPSDQPFFAQVTLNVTHRGGWWNQVRNQSEHKVDPADVVLPPYYADHPAIREDWAKYLDQIEYMDNEVGMLLADLEAKGMKENTIVIFIGDNGRCNIRGKGYLYEPGINLPLIVNWPASMTGGKIDERLVSSIDIAASILEVAGVELPDYMTAQPFINNNNLGREYVYSGRDLWDEILEQSRAITTKDFKYIKNNMPEVSYDAHQAYLEFYRPAVHIMRDMYANGELNELQSRFFAPAKEKEELYDLVNDPFETNNLIDDPNYADQLALMRGYFDDWNAKNHDYGFDEIDWENAPPPPGPEVVEWLKKERPDVIEKMKKGIEPNYGKLKKEYQKQHNKKK